VHEPGKPEGPAGWSGTGSWDTAAPPSPPKKIALCRILLKNLNKHHFNSYHFMICIVSKQLPPRLFFYPKIHLSPKIAAGYMSGVGLQFLGMLAGRVKNN